MSLIESLLTMLVVSFLFFANSCLLLLVVVMLHLVQGYIILKLVYFIILTLISMVNIDTSLCLFLESCERENNLIASMSSTYYYYGFTTIVMYVLCKSWFSSSTHFGICLKPIANNPLYTIVMLNHSVWIWTPPCIGGCKVIGFINACKWFVEIKLEVQSLHWCCGVVGNIDSLIIIFSSHFHYLYCSFFQGALCIIIISIGVVSCSFGTYSTLSKIVESFKYWNFWDIPIARGTRIMDSVFVWYLFILPFQYRILHHSSVWCLCIFQ